MVDEEPRTDKDPTTNGPFRQPTKVAVTSALHLFEWIVQFALSHESQDLDQSELDELWAAIDTTLGVVKMGEVGYRRMTDLIEKVDSAREAGGMLDFETAARYVGPVIARLSSELDNWLWPP
jgi:hypothetical protein